MKNTLESFAPTARLCRRLGLLMNVSTVSFMATCVLSVPLGAVLSSAVADALLGKVAVALWFLGFVSMIAYKAVLRCSECAQWLEDIKGPYCPECGNSTLSNSACGKPRGCLSCGANLSKAKGRGKGGRTFKVRYCHGCGAHLDERGL